MAFILLYYRYIQYKGLHFLYNLCKFGIHHVVASLTPDSET